VEGNGGVLIYLTGGAYVDIAGGSDVTLAPHSDGIYQGVLFFQDRTMSNPRASSFVGGMKMNLAGSLYFPRALLNINDGSRENVMALVAWKLKFVGDSRITRAASSSQTGIHAGSPLTIAMIE